MERIEHNSEQVAEKPYGSSSTPPTDKVGDEHSYRPKKGITKKILEVGYGTLLPKAPSIVKVLYKGYVTTTKEVFDTTNDSPLEISLDTKDYPEGFIVGVENMKKGERAEIRMTRKYTWKEEEKIPERLKEKAGILKGKGITYEVKLLGAVIRMDLNGDKKLIKTIVEEGVLGKIPGESDQVKVNAEVYQNGIKKWEEKDWHVYANSLELPMFLQLLVKSMEKSERCTCNVKKEFICEKDAEFCEIKGIDLSCDLQVKAELVDVKEAQDVYKDQTTYKQLLVEGVSGVMPTTDSTVDFAMKVLVNGKVVFSNFQVKSLVTTEIWDLDSETDKIATTDSETIRVTLNEYVLPPAIHKLIKTMNLKGMIKIKSNNTEKLLPLLPNEWFKEHYVKPGDIATIFIHLKDIDTAKDFTEVPIAEKKARILKKKDIASKLFKAGKIRKACRLYQKINEYFNFGDLDTAASGEDSQSKTYKDIRTELETVKRQCFLNVAVCKYKLGEYQSCANVAQEVVEMDPSSVKGYFWVAKGLFAVKNYKDAVKAIEAAFKLDPNNSEVKEEYGKIKEGYQKFVEQEHKKYSKMFA